MLFLNFLKILNLLFLLINNNKNMNLAYYPTNYTKHKQRSPHFLTVWVDVRINHEKDYIDMQRNIVYFL
jgi:hypothetical protein